MYHSKFKNHEKIQYRITVKCLVLTGQQIKITNLPDDVMVYNTVVVHICTVGNILCADLAFYHPEPIVHVLRTMFQWCSCTTPYLVISPIVNFQPSFLGFRSDHRGGTRRLLGCASAPLLL